MKSSSSLNSNSWVEGPHEFPRERGTHCERRTAREERPLKGSCTEGKSVGAVVLNRRRGEGRQEGENRCKGHERGLGWACEGVGKRTPALTTWRRGMALRGRSKKRQYSGGKNGTRGS